MIDLSQCGSELASVVTVASARQLTGDIKSNVEYLIDGNVNMAVGEITVPVTGMTVSGVDASISKLETTADNKALFTRNGFSGRLTIKDLTIEASGVDSRVFSLESDVGAPFLIVKDCQFLNCTEIGGFTKYGSIFFEDCIFLGCKDGILLDGIMADDITFTNCKIISGANPFTGTFLKHGATLSIEGSVRSNMNATGIDDAGTFCNFLESNIENDAAVFMDNLRANPSAEAFSNIPSSSVKARFINCIGFENTHVGCHMDITSEEVTTITAQDTLFQMQGMAAYSDLNWFETFGDNSCRYISSEPIPIEINGTLPFKGATNLVMKLQIRQWDDSTSSYINIDSEYSGTLNGNGGADRAESITFGGYAELNKNDRIELWVKNANGTQNITTLVGGGMRIKIR